MSFALSTSWNASRVGNARRLIFEIRALGFNQVELSFNLSPAMVRDIKELVRKKEITVSSLHNFCPVPEGISRFRALPDYYPISSPDETIRKRSVNQTKKTIFTAKSLAAKAVVLHCGRVEIPDQTRKLIKLYSLGRKNSREFIALKNRMVEERELLAKPFFAQAIKSLEELNTYARKNNILLGVEARFYFREIPSFAEIGVVLKKFRHSNIFYWHDTGHAQIMQNLGFARHKDYLELYADRMLGVHLHDIKGCSDHQAPLKGDFDFAMLKPYLKPDTLKVIEAHEPASAQELIEGKKFLEKTFGEGK